MTLIPREWLDEQLAKAKADKIKKRKERPPVSKENPKGQKYSNCKHMIRHPYSDKYNYCNLRSSKLTYNGRATTTRSGWCDSWEGKP